MTVIDYFDKSNEVGMVNFFQNRYFTIDHPRVVSIHCRVFVDDFHSKSYGFVVHHGHAILDAAKRAPSDGLFQEYFQRRFFRDRYVFSLNGDRFHSNVVRCGERRRRVRPIIFIIKNDNPQTIKRAVTQNKNKSYKTEL